MSGGSSWEIPCREVTEAHPNIEIGTAKSDQEPYNMGILQYSKRVREILDGPILCMGTRNPILIIQDNPTLTISVRRINKD